MKTALFITALVACVISYSQAISFPMKNNNIHYSNIVLTSNNTSPESITEKLNEWVNLNTAQYSFAKQGNSTIGNLISVNGKMNIDPNKSSLHNVDCEFTMEITIIDGRYRAELFGFMFIKADQKFDASEVYKGYLKREPFVKTTLEARQAALARHEFLLEKLQSKVNTLLASMQRAVEE